MTVRLAIVVPAYDESARIGPTLATLAAFVASLPYSCQVLVVSDGSKDGTEKVVSDFAQSHPGFQCVHYAVNRGKGYAVKQGVFAADAEYILVSDADLATPIDEVDKLWKAIDAGADVAIGSRPLRESQLEVRQPFYREMAGRMFNLAVQLLAVRGIKDTQCGFKLFRAEVAREIFRRATVDRFGFDFEALMIAHDLGYRIAEIPVRWRHQEGSKVVLLRDGPEMLGQLVRLRLKGKAKRLALPAEAGRAE
ncbi:MAG: glycosyltransferase family 2 protein [Fimbriimonadaceae bacterium]|nr:glycosyltransferase family 2 protein [Fimbriimonadaceae bacterium]